MRLVLVVILSTTFVSVAADGLQLHINFDSYDSEKFLDLSGNTAHAWHFRTGTNRVNLTNGANGTLGGFWKTNYVNPSYPTYPVSQYLGVTNFAHFQFLTNGTISVWARFYPKGPDMQLSSYLLDASYNPESVPNATNSWNLGRIALGRSVRFSVYPATNTYSEGDAAISFDIDSNEDTSTDALKMYTVTFNCTTGEYIAYTNGIAHKTNTYTGIAWLKAWNYLCIGASGHNGTPEFGDDNFPNDQYHHGFIDDVRIYNTTLSAAEVLEIYGYDLTATATAGTVTATTVNVTGQ